MIARLVIARLEIAHLTKARLEIVHPAKAHLIAAHLVTAVQVRALQKKAARVLDLQVHQKSLAAVLRQLNLTSNQNFFPDFILGVITCGATIVANSGNLI